MIDIKEIIYGVRYRVCLDEIKDNQYKGRIYYCYSKNAELFGTSMDLLTTLESAMDRLNYPQKTTDDRSFKKRTIEEKSQNNENMVVKYMEEKDFSEKKGEKSTFIVEIKYRENATWQGTVKWVEGGREQNFRSALELIKLIDSAEKS